MIAKCAPFHILLIISTHCILTNSKASTLWKLNVDNSKIIEGNAFHDVITLQMQASHFHFEDYADNVFNIIASTKPNNREDNLWTKRDFENYCIDCYYTKNASDLNLQTTFLGANSKESLSCGKPVNFTYYDHLVGVLNRNTHPNVPEPQTAWLFSKYLRKNDIDVEVLERKLRKNAKEKPKSVQLYNQIGNFWRIKGETRKSIECFRRALSLSPHSAEVLLNLARVLFNLQYLDDAIFLTRRSLEVQLPDKETWQQHFTLGEIFKAYGHLQEAAVHLKHTLELKPNFEPALLALRQMEATPTDKVHLYTLIIIIFLVIGVLFVILSRVEPLNDSGGQSSSKVQRHFNKAMAMKTLRGFTKGSSNANKSRCKI